MRLHLAPIAISMAAAVACREPLTPDQHVQNLEVEVAVVKLGCFAYLRDPSFPRKESLTKDCEALLLKKP